jgi:hypothetical protein
MFGDDLCSINYSPGFGVGLPTGSGKSIVIDFALAIHLALTVVQNSLMPKGV